MVFLKIIIKLTGVSPESGTISLLEEDSSSIYETLHKFTLISLVRLITKTLRAMVHIRYKKLLDLFNYECFPVEWQVRTVS